MARMFSLLCWVITFRIILAAPASRQSTAQTGFKVQRVRNENYVADGKAAMRKAYLKFQLSDIALNPDGDAAAVVRGDPGGSIAGSIIGETTATGANNEAEFVSPVSIGGQTITMDFDTGSSDFWVFNTNLDVQLLNGHNVYAPHASETAQYYPGAEFSVTYGDGSGAVGPVGFDTVSIGGATVTTQAIGLPTSITGSFAQDTSSNGLVGLSFSKLNTVKPQQQKTFFDNVVPELAQPVFTANLKAGSVGSYDFGQIDTTAFTGQLSQVPVSNQLGFWQFESTTFEVNGQQFPMDFGTAIADTGTSLMLVPSSMAKMYWSQVPTAQYSSEDGGFSFDCDEELPDLIVSCGTYSATIAGANMNFARSGSNRCFGGLQPLSGSMFAVYGDVFFKSQFVAFQAPVGGSPSLAMAPHA